MSDRYRVIRVGHEPMMLERIATGGTVEYDEWIAEVEDTETGETAEGRGGSEDEAISDAIDQLPD